MKTKDTTIIRCLIEHGNEELNIRMLSRLISMDYKNVYSIVKRLEKESLIKIESFGQSKRIALIRQIHPIIFEAEYSRRKDVLKDKNLAVMLSNFKRAIKSRCYILLLFGSYARKTQTRNSDIDLMFICPNGLEDSFEKEVNRAARSMPLPLHPLVFSETQFTDMVNAKEPNVGQEALKNNIILYGIEQYYEVI